MSFDFGEGADCFSVSIDGDNDSLSLSVMWMVEGDEDGSGTISSGNPKVV